MQLKTGWPLVAFYAAYPLWWAAGLGTIGLLLVAFALAYHLLRLRTVRVPKGFGVWLFLLVWVAMGAVTLWMDAPSAVPANGLGRLVPFVYFFCWYIAGTIFLLYVGNTSEEELPTARIVRLLSTMFLITVVGGYVGALAPTIEFASLLEVVLPRTVSGNDFVQVLIHPGVAQIMDILGYEAPRPKAPYLYANDWGANYGLLLPFFVLAWWSGPNVSRRRRLAFPFIALVSIPPAIFSLNRGLWLGLTVMTAYVALRLAFRGRIGAVAGVAVATIVAVVVIALTPLGTLFEERLANPHSDEGRGNLAGMAVESAWEGSPLLGFGSRREVQGNFFSIAGAATAECPKCSPPQLGTQGHLWFLVFTSGFVGAALFIGFIAYRLGRGLRDPSTTALALTAGGVFFAVVTLVYDLMSAPLITLMISIGILWRAERNADSTDAQQYGMGTP